MKWVVRRGNVAASTNFNGESEPNGVMINYYQKAPASGDVTVKIMQGSRVVAETKGPNAAGMNQVLWNMRATAVTIPGQAAPPAGGRGGMGGGGFGGPQAPRPIRRSAARCRPRLASTPSSSRPAARA